MIYTPNMNDGHNVFVFGSNESGIHGAGVAREAFLHWGAIKGQGFGLMGHSFGIPTNDWKLNVLPLTEIEFYVRRFKAFANNRQEKRFLVTPIGTGLSGYTHQRIAPLFYDHSINCVMPEEWKGLL